MTHITTEHPYQWTVINVHMYLIVSIHLRQADVRPIVTETQSLLFLASCVGGNLALLRVQKMADKHTVDIGHM